MKVTFNDAQAVVKSLYAGIPSKMLEKAFTVNVYRTGRTLQQSIGFNTEYDGRLTDGGGGGREEGG